MGLWIVGWKASEGKEGEGEERGGREGGDGGGLVYRMQNSRGWPSHYGALVLHCIDAKRFPGCVWKT